MKRFLILSILLLGLGACGGGGEDNTVEFSQFVIDEINLTNENDVPAEVNDINFRFNEDATAFDSVL